MSYRTLPSIDKTLFRAYDIRGIVKDGLTVDAMYTIAKALAKMAVSRGQSTIITARDGRLTSADLHAACNAGFLDSGLDVIDIGAVPTPVMYFAAHTLSTQSAVIVTGSHNPAEYNGLKMMIAGTTLTAADIADLHQRILDADFLAENQGRLQTVSVVDSYLQTIVSKNTLSRPLKVVVDCGNGIPGAVAPEVLRACGAEVIELFCDVDGRFPNHHPDPSEHATLAQLQTKVRECQADCGIAYDGDGDRLGVVTNSGEVVAADQLLMLLAIDFLDKNPNASILFDVKCSDALAEVIRQHDGHPVMWQTGHSIIKAKMAEDNIQFAGEMSGHIFFADDWYGFDDGIYSSTRLLHFLAQNQQTLAELIAELPKRLNTPEIKIAIAEHKKFDFVEKFQRKASELNAEIVTIDGVRAQFADGWGLLRASNTTPNLICRFEANSDDALQRIRQQFSDLMQRIDEEVRLPRVYSP